MGVKFNEGLACEAIVRRLESRDQRVRANVRFPEKEQHAFSVEATFEIDDQLYVTSRQEFSSTLRTGSVGIRGRRDRSDPPRVVAL